MASSEAAAQFVSRARHLSSWRHTSARSVSRPKCISVYGSPGLFVKRLLQHRRRADFRDNERHWIVVDDSVDRCVSIILLGEILCADISVSWCVAMALNELVVVAGLKQQLGTNLDSVNKFGRKIFASSFRVSASGRGTMTSRSLARCLPWRAAYTR